MERRGRSLFLKMGLAFGRYRGGYRAFEKVVQTNIVCLDNNWAVKQRESENFPVNLVVI